MVGDILASVLKEGLTHARNWNTPDPRTIQKALTEYSPTFLNRIIYNGEPNTYSLQWNIEMMKKFGNYSGEFVRFSQLFQKYLDDEKFKALLIPPKRALDMRSQIAKMNEAVDANGGWILNRLFYLKNQDKHSEENKRFERIYDAFQRITDGYCFHIPPTKDNEIFIQFSKDSKNWVDGSACGLGLCDVLIILCHILDNDSNMILLEEPESHIHPSMQRKLVEFIKEQVGKQFFLSTHSNVFLDTNYVDKIIYVEMTDNGIVASDETTKANALTDLGYSVIDNLTADVVVLVEGPLDAAILREVFKKMLIKHNIKFHFLGGNAMEHVDLEVILEKNKAFAVIDLDPESDRSRKAFQAICKRYGVDCTQLKRRSIENYFSIDAIREEFPGKINQDLTQLDGNKSIREQIGFEVKRHGAKIIKRMTIENLNGTDLIDFCHKIDNYIKQQF